MSSGNRFTSQAAGWLFVIAAFAALNGLLWVGQEIWHHGDKKQAEQIEADLRGLELLIDEDEHWLEANRSRYESHGPVYVFNARVDQHSQRVDQYNAMVVQYNSLAKRAYSRWYLIPIPGRSRSTRAPRTVH